MAFVAVAARDGLGSMTRVQKTVFANRERQLLNWLCVRMPARVMPDHLTLVGVGGAVMVFAGFVLSSESRWWLWLAMLGLVVHWFGDSLDGSLARYRRTERPLYGYFLDHTVDAICNLLLMLGLGCTPWVRMDVALFALVGYYLLCMYVFINNQVSGVFQLSFIWLGPTELRLALILISIWMFFCGWVGIHVAGVAISYYDMLLLFAGACFVTIFGVRVLAGIRDLRDRGPDGRSANALAIRPVQSASRNAVSRAK